MTACGPAKGSFNFSLGTTDFAKWAGWPLGPAATHLVHAIFHVDMKHGMPAAGYSERCGVSTKPRHRPD